MVLVVHTVPIIRCLLDLMTLRQWFQKLRMNGQRKMRRSQRKLLHLLIVKHGGSAGIAIMNGIHLFLHAQAEASALVPTLEKCEHKNSFINILLYKFRFSQFSKLEFEQKPKGLMSPMLFSFLLLFQFKHSQFVRFFFLTAPHFTLLFILFLL